MKVSELIEEKALFKYIPRDKMNPCDVVGLIEDNEEYFLITNTKEIYKKLEKNTPASLSGG